MKDLSLLPLRTHEVYACENGCGSCMPVEYDYEYRTQTDLSDGSVTKFTHKAFKSDCCGADIYIYDHSTGNDRTAEGV
jgi:hypothetical protein